MRIGFFFCTDIIDRIYVSVLTLSDFRVVLLSTGDLSMKYALGFKILLLMFLAILLLIPLNMVRGVVHDRIQYRDQVVSDIAKTWTGAQQISGPVMSITYETTQHKRTFNKETKKYETSSSTLENQHYLLPKALNVEADVATQLRARGIYTVPVFSSKFSISGQFDVSSLKELEKSIKGFSGWKRASLGIMIQDVRGIDQQPTMRWNQQPVSFEIQLPQCDQIGLILVSPASFYRANTRLMKPVLTRRGRCQNFLPGLNKD